MSETTVVFGEGDDLNDFDSWRMWEPTILPLRFDFRTQARIEGDKTNLFLIL